MGRYPAIIIIDDPVVEDEDQHGHAVFGGIFLFFLTWMPKLHIKPLAESKVLCKGLHTHIYILFHFHAHFM